MLGWLKKIFGTQQSRTIKRYRKLVQQVNACEVQLQGLSDEQLRAKTAELKQRIADGATTDELLPEAYAVVKNCCRRLCGQEIHVSGYNQVWDMVPYDVQILGGIALHNGSIAEMQTGEGKTLTASMPLYLNALTGKPVHLVTVNDYLAKRDCEWVGAIFRWLGLTTAALTGETPPQMRRSVYDADIVYGTASEFGFDYLRDNSMVSRAEEQVQRGHYFALIDEIDSILIDEARTPLIISGPSGESRHMYDALSEQVASLVKLQARLCDELLDRALATLKELNLLDQEEWPKLDKEGQAKVSTATKTLWLVGRGMPRNKRLLRCKENPAIRGEIENWETYFHSDQNKDERRKFQAELFIVIEERSSDFELTDAGIGQWEKLCEHMGHPEQGSFELMDLGHEYALIDANGDMSAEDKLEAKVSVREEDAQRKERLHNLRQLLRAHLMMQCDVEYIVQDNKIIIIDENTGRPQPGRRFSDGLHQAIEAKENCPIQAETQTYATVTLQNYFRLYDKLAGMTGTAMTEASEFKETYKLDVLEIPTHRTCRRSDADDLVFMSEREKLQAIVEDIKEVHAKGRPILVGTESVEASEKIAGLLQAQNLPVVVLNARHHEREAEIIAEAGRRSAITISTNMAGRGTDIKLAPEVAELGGLYVIGSTRHPSRRIDRQLRGRCARQGDPGSSRFYLSFEDSLLRLFSSPRMAALLKRYRPPEGEAISAKLMNRSIETAQKRVEQRNAMMRKHTLEYDDVMNRQRKEVYAFRNDVLYSKEPLQEISSLAEELIGDLIARNLVDRMVEGGWRIETVRSELTEMLPVSFPEELLHDDTSTAATVQQRLMVVVREAIEEKYRYEIEKIRELQLRYMPEDEIPEDQDPKQVFSDACRMLMIRILDQTWQEHLLHIDHLRAEVGLAHVGQKDPLQEFKHSAFARFSDMIHEMHREIVSAFFRMQMIEPVDDAPVHDEFSIVENTELLRLADLQSLGIGDGANTFLQQ